MLRLREYEINDLGRHKTVMRCLASRLASRGMVTTARRFGAELKRWRTHRRFSQLQLAAAADVSQRHLSYLETGRAKPSREMVIHLATTLDVPLRSQNELLISAGFAPAFSETPLEAPAMDQVRLVVDFLLDAHEPYPAIVVDRRWNIIASNSAATRLVARLLNAARAPVGDAPNLARLTFHPEGLRTVTVGWDATAGAALLRLEREVVDRAGDEALAELVNEVLRYPGIAELRREPSLPVGEDLLLPIHYRTDDFEARLFSTFATIGAAYDVTLEELRLETFFPVDAASDEALKRLAET